MTKHDLPNEFILFDTEYTSWEGAQERNWGGPGEYRELLQIGAIKVKDFEEVDSFKILVRPTINPILSEYIKKLTGITQEAVDAHGVLFTEAYADFMEWKGGLLCFSYGGDEKIFVINHELYQTHTRIPETSFFNIKDVFFAEGINADVYMSSTIPRAFGLTCLPYAHDALSDARSILLALRGLLGKGPVENHPLS